MSAKGSKADAKGLFCAAIEQLGLGHQALRNVLM